MKTLIQKASLTGFVATTLVLSGCSTTGNTNSNASLSQTEAVRLADLDQRTADLDAREAQLNARADNASGLPADAARAGDLLPPNAAAGECYARVWVQPEYSTRSEQVLSSEASTKIKVIPAQYETVTQTVLVSAASSRIETTPAVYGSEQESIKIRDGRQIWRVANEKAAAPASDALLAAATAHGIDLGNASVGMCFHEHYVPATYKTVSEQILTKTATESVSIVPAEYEMVEEQVLVREASTKLVNVPAEYGTEEEQIIDKPAHTIWKKGKGPIQKIDQATGEIMCLVDVPATYKTIKRTVLRSPARTETVQIPAEYKTIKVRKLVSAASEQRTPIAAEYGEVSRQVVDQDSGFVWHEISNKDHPTTTRTGNKVCLTETPPEYKTVTRTVVTTPAQSRTIEIPAEYDEVSVTKLVTAAQEQVTQIPAEYRDVEKRELVKEGYMAWRSILCETNMTRSRIADIQRALKAADHDIGPDGVDGVIGVDTIKAINAFQRANDLPVDRYINVETLKVLGVSPK
jgi:peptidoglycan hydrolase-like protein with peptidoglycan-binding domain